MLGDENCRRYTVLGDGSSLTSDGSAHPVDDSQRLLCWYMYWFCSSGWLSISHSSFLIFRHSLVSVHSANLHHRVCEAVNSVTTLIKFDFSLYGSDQCAVLVFPVFLFACLQCQLQSLNMIHSTIHSSLSISANKKKINKKKIFKNEISEILYISQTFRARHARCTFWVLLCRFV